MAASKYIGFVFVLLVFGLGVAFVFSQRDSQELIANSAETTEFKEESANVLTGTTLREGTSAIANESSVVLDEAESQDVPVETPVDEAASEPEAPTTVQVNNGGRDAWQYISPTSSTDIPVYDTAWQLLALSTPEQADEYFRTLNEFGFSGSWIGVIHHGPATYADDFAGGGRIGNLVDGEIVLSPEFIVHSREILDAAQRHQQKVGLVVAWQNTYLPGGLTETGQGRGPEFTAVQGTLTAANSYAYGQQMVEAFGDHPAVSVWVFGGDAGHNNTDANIPVWRNMAEGVRDAGSELPITYHTPTNNPELGPTFTQLNYAGEPWLDFISPETGHAQSADKTGQDIASVRDAYEIPVWQGEPRYFNINFGWVPGGFRNPGVAEVRADAEAAKRSGVSGYVYGDGGRWHWCQYQLHEPQTTPDSTPCDPNNIAASFGDGERSVIEVFSS